MKPGRHSDGGGLYLDIAAGGRKAWVFLYRSPNQRIDRAGKRVGKQREKGLGSVTDVSLVVARGKDAEARRSIADGKDPLDGIEQVVEPKPAPSFGAFADVVILSLEGGWKNKKTVAHWRNTLGVHAEAIRSIPVDRIATEHVLLVLQPIWVTKNETAAILRGRIEKVLDAATAKGLRIGDNPARWRGHLSHLLPPRKKLQRGHHPAMPWEQVPEFVTRLRGMQSLGALALEFTILTAARSGESRGARWAEFDLDAQVWTVPAIRMKAGREHRVPLTDRMSAILAEVALLHREDDGFVFPGQTLGRPLSEMTLEAVLRRLDVKPVTVHGFRSSFRDWCGECTHFPRELAEAALAHSVGDAVERAYRRGDALERRRQLMAAWTMHVGGGSTGNVVPLPTAKRL